jgi:Na+/melibiose symporter-like transporter
VMLFYRLDNKQLALVQQELAKRKRRMEQELGKSNQ